MKLVTEQGTGYSQGNFTTFETGHIRNRSFLMLITRGGEGGGRSVEGLVLPCGNKQHNRLPLPGGVILPWW